MTSPQGGDVILSGIQSYLGGDPTEMQDDQHMLFEHRQTWIGFCALLKWSIIAIVILLLILYATLV